MMGIATLNPSYEKRRQQVASSPGKRNARTRDELRKYLTEERVGWVIDPTARDAES